MTPSTRDIRTKVIATLGPASARPDRLARMVDVGLDICRLNFSHGDLATHGQTLQLVRELAAQRGEPICVVGDLCGPKIRLGEFAAPVTVEAGQTLRFERGDGPCTADRLTISYAGFIDEVDVDQRVLIGDGLVRLAVRERQRDAVLAEVVVGGVLKSRKGVNLPDSKLATPALTEKDLIDLHWAIEHDLDYIALSFVRRPDDLYALKRAIKQAGSDLPVIIKIEKPEALEHLDELIMHSDAVLVARGDLGVETDIWRVPLIQKDLVSRCRRAGVPVIVATQMLESMIEHALPTRAEVSDVANAVFDQADAVMLSAETAVGEYPVQAVEMMNQIVASTGEYLAQFPPSWQSEPGAARFRPTAAIAHAAVQAARDVAARLVAVWTAGGGTVRLVARHRLPIPVVGVTHDERVWRRMNLVYGVIPLRVAPADNPADLAGTLDKHLLAQRLADIGDVIVVVTSTQPMLTGATDTTLLHRVGGKNTDLHKLEV